MTESSREDSKNRVERQNLTVERQNSSFERQNQTVRTSKITARRRNQIFGGAKQVCGGLKNHCWKTKTGLWSSKSDLWNCARAKSTSSTDAASLARAGKRPKSVLERQNQTKSRLRDSASVSELTELLQLTKITSTNDSASLQLARIVLNSWQLIKITFTELKTRSAGP
jgi:hypothetical protein